MRIQFAPVLPTPTVLPRPHPVRLATFFGLEADLYASLRWPLYGASPTRTAFLQTSPPGPPRGPPRANSASAISLSSRLMPRTVRAPGIFSSDRVPTNRTLARIVLSY